MSSGRPLSARLYAFALKALVPSLGPEYVGEAASTFADLRRDVRHAGFSATCAFFVREGRSLLRVAAEARRDRRRDRRTAPGKSGGNRTGNRFDTLRLDLRYALRSLFRSPGFVAVSLLSLTFGIAVSSVVFSVANAALFRPVPHVADQDRLVQVFTSTPRHPRGPSSFPDFQDYRAMSETLQDLAAVGSKRFAVGEVGRGTREVWGQEVSENYFRLLGIPLSLGRGFLEEDVAAGGKVVVIGHNTWRREFDGAPDVLGRTLQLNGHSHTVVGVGPPGMVAVGGPRLLEIVVPITEFREERGRMALAVVGRLRPGATVGQAQAEFDAVARRLAEGHPDYWKPGPTGPQGLRVLSHQEARIPEGAPLAAVFGGIGALVCLIMLIACSNVANLLLTRGLKRRTEIAIRSAIGAPVRRVFGQLLTEHLLLFLTAGGLGLLLTQGLASVLDGGWTRLPLPGVDVSVDLRVALFTLAVTVGTGLTFGLVPAFQAARTSLLSGLRGEAPLHRFRFLGIRNLLVGAQVGGSLLLVVVTSLLVRSLSHARSIDPGFDPTGVATLKLDLSHREYGAEEGARFFVDLVDRTAILPGVESVGLASWVPLAGGSIRQGGLEPEGYEAGPEEYVMAGVAIITPGYLAMTRMTLLRGRDFGPEDAPGSGPVALVSQSFVDRYWPGEDGVGKRIGTGGGGEGLQVVGVVADVPYRTLTPDAEPHMWVPLAQNYRPEMVLHARTRGDPRRLLPLMRRQVGDLDPGLPVAQADLMERISANATQPQRVLSVALGAAGLFTLALAILGIYGVVAYSVSQRTREMGLRMALGAEPRKLLGMILREGMALSLIGLVPGLLAALGVSKLLEALLLGMDSLDPLAFSGSVALLLLAVLGASLAPGVRASRAQPMESLRVE